VDKNIYEKVVDKLHERNARVNQKMHAQFSKQRPFRQEPITQDEQYYWYSKLSWPDDMIQLVQKHGEDNVNQYVAEMEKFRQERVKNG